MMDAMTLKMLMFFGATSFMAWILLFVGIGQRRDSRRRKEEEHTHTTGAIVDYVRSEQRGGRSGSYFFWKPVVEFTAEGRKYRQVYEDAMNRDEHPIGETVDIFYNVSDPSRFHLESDPVFSDPGGGAIRIALIWIIASAALTIALAVFVGGASFDFKRMWYDIQRFFILIST